MSEQDPTNAAPAVAPPPALVGGGEPTDWVPARRFQRLVEKHNSLQNDMASMEAQLQSATEKVATVDTLATTLADERAKFDTERSGWAEEKALWSAGLTDDDAVAIARALHSRLPEGDRPDLPSWVGAMAEDPSAAPAGLRAYLASQEAASTTQAPAKAPRKKADTQQHQPATPQFKGGVTREALRAARLHGEKTKDFSRFKELRDAMAAEGSTG